MNIAFVSEHFLPTVDGLSTRLSNTVLQLKKMGHQCAILTRKGESTDFEGVPISRMLSLPIPGVPSKHVMLVNRKTNIVLKALKPDVIHIVNSFCIARSVIRFAKKNGIPVIISFHSNYHQYAEYYGFKMLYKPILWYMRKLHDMADSTLCSSHVFQQELTQYHIHVQDVWRGGVDIDCFQPQYSKAKKNTMPQVLYVGRLAPEKRIKDLKVLFSVLPNLTLTIVGSGCYQQALQQYFTGTNTVFLPEKKHRDLAPYFENTDLLIYPSDTETLGLVVLEAMASGCPVLAANAGGIPEIIQGDCGGFLFEACNTEDLARKAQDFFNNQSNWSVFSKKARAAAEKWSWHHSAALLEQHYQQLRRQMVSCLSDRDCLVKANKSHNNIQF